MIEFKQVTKNYYKLTALRDVSLTIPRGEVLGLLGPNGAGKTTLIKLIAGIITPTQGEICLLYTSPSPRDGLLSRMPSSA
mgnify:CR=1 FL=1